MSNRITMWDLRELAQRLNTLTGSPLEPWGRREDGSARANVGNFHIDGAYGGWCLHRMSNESGGVTMPMGHAGHVPARELYDQMRAFIAGIEFARRGE